MTEVKRLREQTGLTQEGAAARLNMKKSTFASYEQGRRTPDYKTMDRIRKVLGGKDTSPAATEASPHVRRVQVQHAGAGPGQAEEAEEEIVLDERLFKGSGVDFDCHLFVRVAGSSMEPVLSHGQIVAAERTDHVKGQDIYVYWRDDENSYVLAIVQSTPNGLEVEKRGPDPSRTEWTHEREDMYRSEDGDTARIKIVGRVLGSFGRPARQIAAQNEAARHAALALKV